MFTETVEQFNLEPLTSSALRRGLEIPPEARHRALTVGAVKWACGNGRIPVGRLRLFEGLTTIEAHKMHLICRRGFSFGLQWRLDVKGQNKICRAGPIRSLQVILRSCAVGDEFFGRSSLLPKVSQPRADYLKTRLQGGRREPRRGGPWIAHQPWGSKRSSPRPSSRGQRLGGGFAEAESIRGFFGLDQPPKRTGPVLSADR